MLLLIGCFDSTTAKKEEDQVSLENCYSAKTGEFELAFLDSVRCDSLFFEEFLDSSGYEGGSAEYFRLRSRSTFVQRLYIVDPIKISPLIVNLHRIKWLYIQGTDSVRARELTEIPAEIYMLPELEELNLMELSRIKHLPVPIISRNRLKTILVYKMDSLQSIGEGFQKLNALKKILISIDPMLTELSEDLSESHTLGYLQIHTTGIQNFPMVLLDIPNLQTVSMWHNPLDSLPLEICQSEASFDLPFNHLCNLSEDIKACIPWNDAREMTQNCEEVE
jgi:hypothetical protein